MKIIINGLFLSQKITGVQRYAIEMSRELHRLFPEQIKFVAPKDIIHKDIAKELDVEIIGNFTGCLWEQVDLPVYLSKIGNPILLSMRNTAPLFYKKNIIVLHDLIFMKNKNWFSKKFRYLYWICALILYKNALKIVTVSEFSKRDIVNAFEINPNKILIASNAVSKGFRKYRDESFENKRGDFILSVASLLSPRKNIESVIKAFNRVENKRLKLVIVGTEVENFSDMFVLDEAKKNEKIIITGYITDEELSELYKNAKLLVFPSFYEGFGMPPLEAMYFGCPVIASNLTSLPEICKDAAFYVNPYNIDDIASAMEKILNNKDLRNSLIAKGYKRQAEFSWEKSAKHLMKAMKNI